MERYPDFAPAYPLTLKGLLTHARRCPPLQHIHYRDYSYTYSDLVGRVAQLVALLRRLGVGVGDTVGVMDWDSHRYLELFFAVPISGAVLHTVNVRLSPGQIAYTINHAKDVLLFVHTDFIPLIDQMKPSLTTSCQFVVLADPGTESSEDNYEARLARESTSAKFDDFSEDMVATTFYTTGTTGDPKGVFFTHRQIVLHTLGVGLSLAAFGSPFSFRQDDTYMPLTPMFHVHAWGFPFLATLLGVKQVYPGRYEPARLVKLLVEHRVTVTHGVPTILHMLIEHAVAVGVRFNGLKMLIGGSALSRGLCQRAADCGIQVAAGYGMSETCPVLAISHIKANNTKLADQERIDLLMAAGYPLPLVETRIVDEVGNEMAAGESNVGELTVRAPWLTTGYVRNSEASRELWRDGWLHTGDVAYSDEAGYLHITDRLKDVIKSGGEWVSSLSLENILSQYAAVKEAAVVGIANERWGERPVAFVVLHASFTAQTTTEMIREHLLQFVKVGNLQRWAVPEDVRFVTELPRTSVGKIDKRALRAGLNTT